LSGELAESETVDFWRGQFGSDYTQRNPASDRDIRARAMLWSQILHCIVPEKPKSILEVGANVGNNLRALRGLCGAEFFAVEPNSDARNILEADHVSREENIRDGTAAALSFGDDFVELAFTAGVLIHVPPQDLLASCREIHRVAGTLQG